jgi:hypothetical protein
MRPVRFKIRDDLYYSVWITLDRNIRNKLWGPLHEIVEQIGVQVGDRIREEIQ